MRFIATALEGVFIIEPEPHHDERGFFARMYCQNEFKEHRLNTRWVQNNISVNTHRNTIRGMHFQAAPYGEIKLVRCTAGSIFDVVVDVRPSSPTYAQWIGVELSSDNRKALYIPIDIAHGFQTLTANTEVFYLMGAFYEPSAARGLNWNDPTISINWFDLPEPLTISEKDANLPLLDRL